MQQITFTGHVMGSVLDTFSVLMSPGSRFRRSQEDSEGLVRTRKSFSQEGHWNCDMGGNASVGAHGVVKAWGDPKVTTPRGSFGFMIEVVTFPGGPQGVVKTWANSKFTTREDPLDLYGGFYAFAGPHGAV